MFAVAKPRAVKRDVSFLVSFVLHCALVFLWLCRPPIFVRPSSIAWGAHGQSDNLIYFPRPEINAAEKAPRLQLQAKHKRAAKEVARNTAESARAGSPSGSLFNGPATGVEARPALPLVFPDPMVYPWQLAKGVQGDVIVEVTIDQQGNVTETKILQSLQQDIDEKVISTLKSWRFKPATVDGVAISSRQDVHFHFPS